MGCCPMHVAVAACANAHVRNAHQYHRPPSALDAAPGGRHVKGTQKACRRWVHEVSAAQQPRCSRACATLVASCHAAAV